MPNKKEEISTGELARIINKGFDHVTKDINELKKSQERLEAGLKNVKQDLRFTARRFEVKDLESRVEKLEYQIAKIAK
jgi:polyhydroxyalkanoate synthesis regulator phasin